MAALTAKQEPVTLQLQFPIVTQFKHGGEVVETQTITEVTVQPPKGKHMRSMGGVANEVEQGLRMIELLTDLLGPQIDELAACDLAAIGAVVEGFMEAGAPTGTTS